MLLTDFHRTNSNSVALLQENGKCFSYGDLFTFFDEFYSHTGKRTLIFILAENTIGSVACFIACLQHHIVPLLLNCNTDKTLLNRLLITYKPEYIWIPERFFSDLDYKITFKSHGFLLLKTGFQSPEMHESLSFLLPTSGSTGSPKLVRHSYRNIIESAKNVSKVFDIKPSDKTMAYLPMYYTMGLSHIISHLYSGATVLLYNGNLTDPDFWNFLKDQKATSFTGVPYTFEILAKLRFFKMDLPHLKIISQGGGKLNPEIFRNLAIYSKETGKKFIATYGQTEGTARMAYLPAEFSETKTGSIGKAIPNGHLYLVDKKMERITLAETEGELVYEGPNVTLGYAITTEDLSKGDERKGILYTGDIAKMDVDGFFYIVGRVSRFLKLYGLRISLDEMEQLISSTYEMETMCTGSDEKLKVYITKQDLLFEVGEFITRKTGLHHQFFQIIWIDEIPRNEAGKIIYLDS